MHFTPSLGAIMDEVVSCPEGTSFNKLAERLRGRLSRAVLSREVRNLSKKGFLKIVRDPRHKQRKIIVAESLVFKILNKIKENHWTADKITVRNATRMVYKIISTYRSLVEEDLPPFLKSYLKYRAIKHFERILEEVSLSELK